MRFFFFFLWSRCNRKENTRSACANSPKHLPGAVARLGIQQDDLRTPDLSQWVPAIVRVCQLIYRLYWAVRDSLVYHFNSSRSACSLCPSPAMHGLCLEPLGCFWCSLGRRHLGRKTDPQQPSPPVLPVQKSILLVVVRQHVCGQIGHPRFILVTVVAKCHGLQVVWLLNSTKCDSCPGLYRCINYSPQNKHIKNQKIVCFRNKNWWTSFFFWLTFFSIHFQQQKTHVPLQALADRGGRLLLEVADDLGPVLNQLILFERQHRWQVTTGWLKNKPFYATKPVKKHQKNMKKTSTKAKKHQTMLWFIIGMKHGRFFFF